MVLIHFSKIIIFPIKIKFVVLVKSDVLYFILSFCVCAKLLDLYVCFECVCFFVYVIFCEAFFVDLVFDVDVYKRNFECLFVCMCGYIIFFIILCLCFVHVCMSVCVYRNMCDCLFLYVCVCAFVCEFLVAEFLCVLFSIR